MSSVVDCRVYGGLVLSLNDMLRIRGYWICAILHSIGRTCTGSEVDCILYVELVMGL